MSIDQHGVRALSAGTLAWVRGLGHEERVAAGAVVVRRGEAGRALYVIVAGAAEVRLGAAGELALTLARLGPGDVFGEMALLTGEPASADVVATETTTLVVLPSERFAQGLADSTPLRNDMLAMLAARVRTASSGAFDLYQQAEALRALMRQGERTEELVAHSPAMRRVARQLEAAGTGDGAIMLVGEPGVGKAYLGRLLHQRSRGGERPLIEVDCVVLEGDAAPRLLVGADGSQNVAAHIGAVRLAAGGSLLLRHVENLPIDVQRQLAEEVSAHEAAGSAPRLVMTARQGPQQLVAAGVLDPALGELVGDRIVRVPRLADRRPDIVGLARVFLELREGGLARLPTETAHALMERRFDYRNVAELREAVELAGLFAGGGEIRPEHVFTGPKSEGALSELDLSILPIVRGLVHGRGLTVLRGLVLVSFAAVIALCFAAPQALAGRVANAAVWGAWEPALVVAFLGVGRVWCTICPLSTSGLLAQRTLSLGRRAPAWLRRSGIWLTIVGFFAIIWAERAFHMISAPVASAWLLLTLTLLAVGFAVVFEREAWCAHVCPLGALGAAFSIPAALHVRANPSVCATYCSTHPCFKGSDVAGGCSVFHHPLFASSSHQCKLCLACLAVCPHASARLYVRPPLQAVWRVGGLSDALTPFALAVAALAPVMLAAQGPSWVASPLVFTVVGGAAMLLGVLVSRLLPRWLGTSEAPSAERAAKVAFACLVLAWGPLMAYQLANVPGLDGVMLMARAGEPGGNLLPAEGLAVLVLAQMAVVLLAGILASVCLWRIAARERRLGGPLASRRWRTVGAAFACYLVATVALIA